MPTMTFKGVDPFILDIQLEKNRIHPDVKACASDDGCGSTCEISACHSQS